MIILEQKDFEDVLEALSGEKKLFIAGCADCATTCKVGGEEEVAEMKKKLEDAGFEVTGTCIFDTACLSGEVRQKGREHEDAIKNADSVLVLACGTGTQTIGDLLGLRVHPGLESLFIGQVVRLGKYEEKCRACGECVLEYTEGICPVTRCSKGLLNGPCGGYSKDGKCEVDPDKDCAWLLIYERLKERGRLDKMKQVREPKDYSKMLSPRQLVWKKPGAKVGGASK